MGSWKSIFRSAKRSVFMSHTSQIKQCVSRVLALATPSTLNYKTEATVHGCYFFANCSVLFSPGCKKNGKDSEGKEDDLPKPQPDNRKTAFPDKTQKDKPLSHQATPNVDQLLPKIH